MQRKGRTPGGLRIARKIAVFLTCYTPDIHPDDRIGFKLKHAYDLDIQFCLIDSINLSDTTISMPDTFI